MNKTLVAKICIPIVSTCGFAYLSKGDYQQALLGLFLGFIIDIFWILMEGQNLIRKINTKLSSVIRLVDSPVKRINKRQEYIVDPLRESDEILFLTHTATGWLTHYVREFEKRLRQKKITQFIVLDPDCDAFKQYIGAIKNWRFPPADITMPAQFLSSSSNCSKELDDIDERYSESDNNHYEHFKEKYKKIVEILEKNQSDYFKIYKISKLPSINFVRSKTDHIYKFYSVLKNPQDSTFDVLLEIDQFSDKLYSLYEQEFERICSLNNIKV